MSCSCILCSTPKIPPRRGTTQVEGRAFSSGGAGSDLPATPVNEIPRGLNKEQRSAQERAIAFQEDEIPRLNPRFPYRVIPPPLDYVRFPANPPTNYASDE